MSPLEAARPLIGAPYVLLGREPSGWDCWGCVGWVRRHLFGRDTPGFDEGFPQVRGLSRSALAEVMEQLVDERLSAWTEVSPRPGAVVLIRQYERRSHVGVLLTKRSFLHARHGLGTGIAELADPDVRRRLVGVFDAL